MAAIDQHHEPARTLRTKRVQSLPSTDVTCRIGAGRKAAMGQHRELARTLRTMCAKRHQHSCDDIAAFLDTLTPEAAATAVVEGNRNDTGCRAQ